MESKRLAIFSPLASVGFLTAISLLNVIILPGFIITQMGAKSYGLWMVAIGISSIVSFLDLGLANFMSTASNQFSSNNMEGMIIDFFRRISSNFIALITSIEATILAICVFSLIFSNPNQEKVTLLWLIIFMSLGSAIFTTISIPLSKLRFIGYFAKSQRILGYSKAGETIFCIALIACTKSLVLASIVSLIIKVLTFVTLNRSSRNLLPVEKYGQMVWNGRIRDVLTPLIGNLFSAGGNWMRNQGANLVFAHVFGLESAGAFGLLRTFASGARQLMDPILIAITPQLSESILSEHFKNSKRLIKFVWSVFFLVTIFYVLLTLLFGDILIFLWSSLDPKSFIVLPIFLVVMQILDICFLIPLAIFMSINQHFRLSKVYFFSALFSNFFALLFSLRFGLFGFILGQLVFSFFAMPFALTKHVYFMRHFFEKTQFKDTSLNSSKK